MKGCVYPNCRNISQNNSSADSYHRFPSKSNVELCKKWLVNCGLDEDFDCSRSYICSAHFKPDDFEKDSNGEPIITRLKENAEPSVNLTIVKQELHGVNGVQFVDNFQFQSSPTFVLETLAELAVNRGPLDNHHHHFNHLPIQNSLLDRPLNLIDRPVPTEGNDAHQPVVSTVPHIPSSLPASQNWPGDFNFDVSFSQQDKNTKGVSWTYSPSHDKLYVGKDSPCPINFSANRLMPENVKVRAMALYSSPESASEVVVRCVNHALDDKAKNILEADHLVRCESTNATYETDPSTKRHSVVVPFENPPAGQLFSTYIYKFTCFGSCPYGPNRRPLMLVFTLESGGKVLGRRKVDVKICACPGRDRKSDESQDSGTSKKRKETEYVPLSEAMEFTRNVLVPKKSKTSQTPDGVYRINVEDLECYQYLVQMKKLYEICKSMTNMQAQAKKVPKNCPPSSDPPPEA